MHLELFIKRPVLAIALCLLIILLGLSAYLMLPIREYPLLPASRVTITTTFPGASPKVMEGFVSTPMQEVLSGLPHLDYIASKNTEGESLITLKFFIGTDIDAILPQISNRILGLMWKLPKHINSPVIKKINPNSAASGAILYIASLSSELSNEQMTNYLRRRIVPRFESVPGVSKVKLFGKREYAMRIWLNPEKMAAYGITGGDVKRTLLSHNLRSTSGTLNAPYMKLNVSTNTNLATPEAFNNIVIKSENGHYIRIKDIGDTQLGSTNYNTSAFANGQPTVMMAVMSKNRANSIATASRVLDSLHQLKKLLPANLAIKLMWDVTQFSRASIREVHFTILEAAAFVFLVIFVFLGSLRTIIVPLVTIPLSILGAAAFMWLLGYSANTLTLLAWVLAIGLVVDDSIVIVENIHRHMELGAKRIEAAINGVYELRFAIITMTLSVAIVFTPIGFIPGISGALFKQFVFTTSLVVLVSGVLALYVSPVMCTRLIPKSFSEKSLTARVDRFFKKIRNAYQSILENVLSMRWLIGIVYVALLFSGLFLFNSIHGELIPDENKGVIIGMGIGPVDANLDYMERYSLAFNKIYKDLPSHQNYGLFNAIPLFGTNVANSWILLKHRNQRKYSEDQIIQQLSNKMEKIPGLLSFAVKMPSIPGALPGQPVSFVLKTTGSYDQLSVQIERLIDAAKIYPGILDPNTTFKMNKIQVNVHINREKASALGVPISEVAETLSIMMGTPIINRFGTFGYSYEVIPQVFRSYRFNPNNIDNMYVRTKSDKLIPLSNLVSMKEEVAPESLNQFQQLRSAVVKASIAPHYTLGQVLNFLENYVKTKMPSDFSYDFIGQSREYVHSKGVLIIAFTFALILIYLLLAAHFNSFREPLIVMLSVPLALVGALYAMYLTDSTLNIYTRIGLIMLVGLISKHGILIIDFANQLQRKGTPRHEAVVGAAAIRLRPILMTTAAMVFGALPLVLAQGAGSVARQQIGWVIIGGMLLGTCLTLFVVPTAYSLFAPRLDLHPDT